MARFSKKVRALVFEKYNGHCGYCGEELKEVKNMQVDHIIPQSDLIYNRDKDSFKNLDKIPEFLKHLTPFDLNHPDNLMPSCRVCNNWKSWHRLEEFREEIAAQVIRLRRDSAAFRMAERYDLLQETGQEIEFHFETMDKYKFLRNHG